MSLIDEFNSNDLSVILSYYLILHIPEIFQQEQKKYIEVLTTKIPLRESECQKTVPGHGVFIYSYFSDCAGFTVAAFIIL
jgi:hypothetical protein